METVNIPVLQNQMALVKDSIQLAGVNDLSARRMNRLSVTSDPVLALKNYNPDYPCILMSHQPKNLDHAVKKGVDLIFSGHTHKGQIFPFHIFVRMAFKYIGGNYEIGPNTNLIVSNGTGFWGPPLRILAPPQIVVIDFKY
jgi:predicted MPP superfamily phosphohydrolase